MRVLRTGACLLTTLVAVVAVAFAPASAAAADDGASTSAYLSANYALVSAAAADIPKLEATLRSLRSRVGRECSAAAAGSPENTDAEQLSNEVIGTMVTTAIRVDNSAGQRFLHAVAGLRWSSASLTRQIASYASHLSRLIALPVPKICGDVRSWAASAFQGLPAATVPFDKAFLGSWVAPGYLPPALARYESAGERALARRAGHLEDLVTELEAREVETWGDIMNELQLLP